MQSSKLIARTKKGRHDGLGTGDVLGSDRKRDSVQRFVQVQYVVGGGVFKVGREHRQGGPSVKGPWSARYVAVRFGDGTWRKSLQGRFMVLKCQSNLPDVVRTRHPAGGLSGGLDRRQQQSNKNPDDRDNDEQFDKRKAPRMPNLDSEQFISIGGSGCLDQWFLTTCGSSRFSGQPSWEFSVDEAIRESPSLLLWQATRLAPVQR